jgi:hypothetical protein
MQHCYHHDEWSAHKITTTTAKQPLTFDRSARNGVFTTMEQQPSGLGERCAAYLTRVRLLPGVPPLVDLQMIAAHEGGATHVTDVLALARVTTHVQIQVAHGHEAAVTLATRKLGFIRHTVPCLVLGQVLLRRKALATNAATKGVAVPVLCLVQLETGAVCERFAALVALEGFLARVVRAAVTLQRRILREGCAAIFALVRLLTRVQALVYLQGFLGFEGATARLAHEGLHVLVCQHVPRFVAGLCEAAPANVARVAAF